MTSLRTIYLVVDEEYHILAGPFDDQEDAERWASAYLKVSKIQRYRLEETW
jgi:hypothetical protein